MGTIEPLELREAILREIDDGIVAVGNNRRVFPYSAIEISFFVLDDKSEGRLRAAFVKSNLLEETIHDHLRPPRCQPAEPHVSIRFTRPANETTPPKGFAINLVSGFAEPNETGAYLEVLEGVANCKQIRLRFHETFIGRCEHPETKSARVIRRNDLYFLDPREDKVRISRELGANERINQSVSRTHAHIAYNENQNTYYVYDDGSRKGTTLLRGGRGITVNVERNVGKALENGDVVCFGKAKVRFKIRASDAGEGE
jgi:hypothetical protein